MDKFNKNFIFGCATAAYQIEGAYNEDGKGMCNWDQFVKIPGKIDNGDTGNVGCDHYHHVDEDIELMKKMHLESYRFSISWSRVLPKGTGEVNEAGIKFYSDLVDKLLANGIEPMITLFHWDLPYELEKQGGFLNEKSIEWYLEYAKLIFERLGDRVKYFITFNEPYVYTTFGYVDGIFPPGCKGRTDFKLLASHNILLAHGKAVKLYRSMNLKGKIGITLDYCINIPVDKNNPKDLQAADEANQFYPGWYYEPVVLGHYPVLARKYFEGLGLMPEVKDGDFDIITEPMDFIGINAYFANYVTYDENNLVHHSKLVQLDFKKTDMYWDITPDGFYDLMKYIQKTSKYPLLITENGIALNDTVVDGKCNDPRRIDYLEQYTHALHKAIDEGLNCIGYCYWSLMDNFEWGAGFRGRFGLIHIDYESENRTRTLKESGYWYKDLIDLKNKGE